MTRVGPVPTWIAGLAVFLAALVVRLVMMETTRFTGEEAHFYSVAHGIATFKHFPLLGPALTSGAARHPGPTFFVLMSLPHFLVEAPEAANAWVEILGAVSVWLVWMALRRPFGEAGALTAGLMLAFAPWSALYADRIWNSNVVGFPVALAFFAAVRVRETPGSKWLILLLGAAAVIPQFHMSAPIIWVALGVLVLPSIKQWNKKWLLVGLGVALIFYIPLIVHEAQTSFGNTRAFLAETFKGGKERSMTFLLIPVYLVRFITFDTSFHILTGYWGGLDEIKALHFLWKGHPDRPWSILWFFFLVASVLISLGAIIAAIRHALHNRKTGQPALGAFAWAALAGIVADIIFLGATGKVFFPPYAQALIPFLFIPHAVLGMTLAQTKRGRIALGVILAVWAVGGTEATWSASRNVDGRNGLAVKRAVIARIHADGDLMALESADPVELQSTYYHHTFSIEVLSKYAFGRPLRLRRGRLKRRYRLQRPYDRAPPNRDPNFEPMVLDHAVLYRLR